MTDECQNESCVRRPLFIQVDSINEKKRAIERNRMVIENPIGGSLKVSNGKFLCDIHITECGISITCKNKYGVVEKISTKDVSF